MLITIIMGYLDFKRCVTDSYANRSYCEYGVGNSSSNHSHCLNYDQCDYFNQASFVVKLKQMFSKQILAYYHCWMD